MARLQNLRGLGAYPFEVCQSEVRSPHRFDGHLASRRSLDPKQSPETDHHAS